jgi:5-methylcytosine-specific restriction protein B
VNLIEKIIKALKTNKNVLLYGPPGTGKSHIMKAVALQMEADSKKMSVDKVILDTAKERGPLSLGHTAGIVTRWVTFHQGYSYEDFILGMRPIANDNGGFGIEPRPGILLELAAHVKKSGEGLLLIDEINRGNTSKIFGEFITIMESDKRLDDAGQPTLNTIEISLPYLSPEESIDIKVHDGVEEVKREFSMPLNLYTLASMNSVDKSISPMDTALRRRFHIINLRPTSPNIFEAVGLPGDTPISNPKKGADLDAADIAKLGALLLIKLNESIALYLGDDFMLGQWYLPPLNDMSPEKAMDELTDVWIFRIVPQLLELFHGRSEQLIEILGAKLLKESSLGIEVREPNDEQRDYGASSYIMTSEKEPSSDDIMKFLREFTGL